MFNMGHAWIGTQHCLREKLEDKEYQCVNDHTGCIYNDGHNGCMFDKESIKLYDSPLLQKEISREHIFRLMDRTIEL